MNILTESDVFSIDDIAKIEAIKDAKFVCETCVKDKQGHWINSPSSIFYCKKAHPVSNSHYFSLFVRNGCMFVANGQSAVDEPWMAVIAKNGDIVYSRYRHDYRMSPDKSVAIDGGRDYTRIAPVNGYIGENVQIRIIGDSLQVDHLSSDNK